jgi:hypothetical protein
MEAYTFATRKPAHKLPEGIQARRSFEAGSYGEALQLASDYWFSGLPVGDTHTDANGVITLLERGTSQGWGGNVIGTLIDWN